MMMVMDEEKPEKRRAPASSTGFKGVVMQQNGRWGAQIYADHRRVWLGTFKLELEAAAAYDTAALRLRGPESHRNFPRAADSDELNFQAGLATDALLAMIRDGSYRAKLADFLLCGNPKNPLIGIEAGAAAVGPAGAGALRQLFQKELTPSDVGKLNRLVIPKKHAMRHFPVAEAGAVLAFTDAEMQPWRFRYCYWRSSQSFVFTRGWSRFVKEKRLRENDSVTFYSCNSGGLIIGVIRGRAAEPDSMLCAPSWGAHAHSRELVEEAENSKPIGIRLFGVQINA